MVLRRVTEFPEGPRQLKRFPGRDVADTAQSLVVVAPRDWAVSRDGVGRRGAVGPEQADPQRLACGVEDGPWVQAAEDGTEY